MLLVSRIRFFFSFLVFCNFISGNLFSQSIEVNSANSSFSDRSLKGFVVCIELDVKTVEKGWSRFLKSIGKFESVERQSYVGLNLMVPNVSSDALDFYSKLSVSPRCVQVFLGALRAGSTMEMLENQIENIKKLLNDFALEQYRQDLISQISEAERVVNLAVKAHDKRENEGRNIKNKIARNKRDRIRLIQDLEQNATNLRRLQTDSTQNISEQETAIEEISKVRKIAEEKKLKLNQIK
jgi:hypothetical protein